MAQKKLPSKEELQLLLIQKATEASEQYLAMLNLRIAAAEKRLAELDNAKRQLCPEPSSN